MRRTKRRRHTATEIHEILTDLESSGLNRREFAINRGIALSTLQNWIRKHGKQVIVGLPEVIPLGTVLTASNPIEIELRGGEIVRLGPGFCGQDLKTVLKELRRC